ncbi:manganese efflux pump MntP family protein [Desulfurispira natronophila]|uniref:Putative manganese efflux pump MntP n=1 Tax=Desulfurispira natronophila TaxID=682562 RepID=A0A7W7Y2P0_9BACT|nr:manganese efflux pump MntP family protein [Desulfurispira natronophila]MBB5020962.1 putative Mn2+ efflux pump MntP [Desulfurispira natronophila]
MDSLAVSIVNGAIVANLRLRYALKLALIFALFQGIMPVLGYVAGNNLRYYIEHYAHWVAFALLLGIGGKMIWESLRIGNYSNHCPLEKSQQVQSLKRLCLLGFATSIDAMAIGVTFSLLGLSLLLPVMIIGVITFIFSLTGVYIGNKFGFFNERYIEFTGGVILVLIGVSILI